MVRLGTGQEREKPESFTVLLPWTEHCMSYRPFGVNSGVSYQAEGERVTGFCRKERARQNKQV